jgi:hypothetical protein
LSAGLTWLRAAIEPMVAAGFSIVAASFEHSIYGAYTCIKA